MNKLETFTQDAARIESGTVNHPPQRESANADSLCGG